MFHFDFNVMDPAALNSLERFVLAALCVPVGVGVSCST
jgi:hypothetical protein